MKNHIVVCQAAVDENPFAFIQRVFDPSPA